MPKPKLDAKLVVDDIRAGLDDAALMEKYNLSVKGLHSLLQKMVKAGALNESAIWIRRPPKEAAAPQGERELSGKAVLRDIKAGMSDGQLMRKYRLSVKGLQNLFEQLIKAGLIKESDLDLGNPPMEHTVELGDEVLPPLPVAPAEIAKRASVDMSPHSVTEAKPTSTPPLPAAEAASPTVDRDEQVEQKTAAHQHAGEEPPPEEQPYADTIPLMPALEETAEQAAPQATEMKQETSKTKAEVPDDDKTIEISDDTEIMSTLTVQEEQDGPAADTTVPETVVIQIHPEDSSVQASDTTVELIWKCPACSSRQTTIVDECPECGFRVAQARGQQRTGSGSGVATLIPSSETAKRESPRQVRRDPVRRPAQVEPAKSVEIPRDGATEPSSYVALARFSKRLNMIAVLQFVLAVLYVCIRIFVSYRRGDTVDVYLGETAWPIVISLAGYLLLRALACALRLGIDIAEAAKSNNRLLRRILRVTIEPKG